MNGTLAVQIGLGYLAIHLALILTCRPYRSMVLSSINGTSSLVYTLTKINNGAVVMSMVLAYNLILIAINLMILYHFPVFGLCLNVVNLLVQGLGFYWHLKYGWSPENAVKEVI